MNALAEILASDCWAMEPGRLRAFFRELAALPTEAEIKAARVEMPSADPDPGYETRDGVAHLPVQGVILKSVPAWLKWFGIKATGTHDTRRAFGAALSDPEVKAIVLDVDSPGGTVAGVQELADTIYGARGQKPARAHIQDLGASAAYWIGSQTDAVSANTGAEVGSIGIFSVIDDYSRLFEREGIVTHVISTHELKGTGVLGAPITKAQIEDVQREVNAVGAEFATAVARGRGMSAEAIAGISTGQVWLASEAQKLGLIDRVESAEDAHAGAIAAADSSADPGPALEPASVTVSNSEPTEPAAVASEETVTAPPGASEEAMPTPEGQGKAGAAVTADGGTELEVLRAENARLKAENDARAASLAEVQASRRRELLEKYGDRITPAMQASVDNVVKTSTPEQLEKFLADLPVQTRAKPVGGTPSDQQESAASDDQQIADLFGLTTEQVALFGEAVRIEPAAGSRKARVFYKNGTSREVN